MPAHALYINLLLFGLGLVVILKGSDLFLDNAIWIARVSGIPQIIIGATIVSACTTLPEVVSSCTASFRGASDMAFGNAVGSVLCNTGVILAVVLWSVPATVNRRSLGIRGGFLLLLLLTGYVFALPAPVWKAFLHPAAASGPSVISRMEAAILLASVVVYLGINYHESVTHAQEQRRLASLARIPAADGAARASAREWCMHVGWFFLGTLLVAAGAFLLVEYGQRLARDFGVSEAVVSLLFIAFGTSLPELFTAITAIRHNAEDISVGNILGANVLNIALATGAAGIIRPLTFTDNMLLRMDIPVAFALCGVITIGGLITGRLGRKTGACLFATYMAYILSMFLVGRIG